MQNKLSEDNKSDIDDEPEEAVVIPPAPADAGEPDDAIEEETEEELHANEANSGYTIIDEDGTVREVEDKINDLVSVISKSRSGQLFEGEYTAAYFDNPGDEAELPDGAPYEVVPDSRLSRFPYRAVGRLRLGCTGTFVGPRHIITAAHCVWNKDKNEPYPLSQLRFRRGRHGSYSMGELFEISRVYLPNAYKTDEDYRYDYAMMITKQRLDEDIGYMSFGVLTEEVPYKTRRIHFNGYPANHGKRMYHTHCIMKTKGKRLLLYPCDTLGGMSGSAVYMLYEDGRRIIYGIHSGPWNNSYNRGARITPTAFARLQDWKQQHS